MDTQHLIITIILGLISLLIGKKVPRDTHLSFIFVPVFIIVATIGVGISYVYSFPLPEWEDTLTEWGGPIFLMVLFMIVLGLPFMVNHSEIALKFIGITLLLSFAVGLWIFSHTFFAFVSTICGFLIGLLLRTKKIL